MGQNWCRQWSWSAIRKLNKRRKATDTTTLSHILAVLEWEAVFQTDDEAATHPPEEIEICEKCECLFEDVVRRMRHKGVCTVRRGSVAIPERVVSVALGMLWKQAPDIYAADDRSPVLRSIFVTQIRLGDRTVSPRLGGAPCPRGHVGEQLHRALTNMYLRYGSIMGNGKVIWSRALGWWRKRCSVWTDVYTRYQRSITYSPISRSCHCRNVSHAMRRRVKHVCGVDEGYQDNTPKRGGRYCGPSLQHCARTFEVLIRMLHLDDFPLPGDFSTDQAFWSLYSYVKTWLLQGRGSRASECTEFALFARYSYGYGYVDGAQWRPGATGRNSGLEGDVGGARPIGVLDCVRDGDTHGRG